jgi:hypothetical protein
MMIITAKTISKSSGRKICPAFSLMRLFGDSINIRQGSTLSLSSTTLRDKRLATFVISLHFACPLAFPFGLADEAELDLRGGDFFLFADFAGCLSTMSKSDILNCRIGP